jgi:hypothetical protein
MIPSPDNVTPLRGAVCLTLFLVLLMWIAKPNFPEPSECLVLGLLMLTFMVGGMAFRDMRRGPPGSQGR